MDSDSPLIDRSKLLREAWLAKSSAYAPYSNFRVGSAIQTRSGEIFAGCNVENASYGGTICAERVAISTAVAAGQLGPGDLVAVLVATQTPELISPCGICRQFIEEFATSSTLILLSNDPDQVGTELRHTELLPHSFNPSHLD